jgi:hypothetical protein
MIALAAAALLISQLHAWLVTWTGAALPDPFPVLVALVGLNWPRRSLVGAVVLLAWPRALALAEPVGGHVLAVAAAVLLLSALRTSLDGRRAGSLVLGALLAAVTLVAVSALLRALSGAPLTAGWALLLGAGLALPLALPARAASRRMRRAPA